MRTRRTFLIALFGMPLFGDVGTLWRKFSSTKFASILGLRAGADAGQTVTAIIDVMFPGDAAPARCAVPANPQPRSCWGYLFSPASARCHRHNAAQFQTLNSDF